MTLLLNQFLNFYAIISYALYLIMPLKKKMKNKFKTLEQNFESEETLKKLFIAGVFEDFNK